MYRDWFIMVLQLVCGTAGLVLLILGLVGIGAGSFILGGAFLISVATISGDGRLLGSTSYETINLLSKG